MAGSTKTPATYFLFCSLSHAGCRFNRRLKICLSSNLKRIRVQTTNFVNLFSVIFESFFKLIFKHFFKRIFKRLLNRHPGHFRLLGWLCYGGGREGGQGPQATWESDRRLKYVSRVTPKVGQLHAQRSATTTLYRSCKNVQLDPSSISELTSFCAEREGGREGRGEVRLRLRVRSERGSEGGRKAAFCARFYPSLVRRPNDPDIRSALSTGFLLCTGFSPPSLPPSLPLSLPPSLSPSLRPSSRTAFPFPPSLVRSVSS